MIDNLYLEIQQDMANIQQ